MNKEIVRHFIAANPGVSSREVSEATEVKYSTVRSLMTRMRQRGLVENIDGRYFLAEPSPTPIAAKPLPKKRGNLLMLSSLALVNTTVPSWADNLLPATLLVAALSAVTWCIWIWID